MIYYTQGKGNTFQEPREDKMKVKDEYTDTKELVQECMDIADEWGIECDEEFILKVLIRSMDKRFQFWHYEVNSQYSYCWSENDTVSEMLDFD